VQRYGAEVAGGAEQHCRQFATRLAVRGHDVDVVTTRARSAGDWADAYPPGTTTLDGVTVHRLDVTEAKDEAAFDALTTRAIWGRPPPTLAVQQQWLRAQGPAIDGLAPWLAERGRSYETVVFFTYLFTTCWAGLPAAAGRVPTVLHATAHDEPYFWLPAFDTVLRLPSAYAWSTEEERDLLARRGAGRRPGMVIGVGVDPADGADLRPFRTRVPALGDRPYLVYVGRVTAGKGALELIDSFTNYKRSRPGPLALVLVGEMGVDAPGHPDVICTGFVDDPTRAAAMGGAVAVMLPSRYESFSMVLVEAWAQGRPAIVQGHSDVLAGQGRRSGAGIAYHSYAEWEAAVDLLTEEPATASALGAAGRRYVETEYAWDTVLSRYERLLDLAGHARHS